MLLLSALFSVLLAPGPRTLAIVMPDAVKPFDRLVYAIGHEECRFDTLAVNPTEQAYGYFQIRQIRLDDYRQRTGIHYTLTDMLDYSKAERVFMFYAMKHGPDNPELIARQWNGSGPATVRYWERVRRML